MNRLPRVLLFLLLSGMALQAADVPNVFGPLLSATTNAPAVLPADGEASDEIEIRPLSDDFLLDYFVEDGTATATNGVQIQYRDSTLTARAVRIDLDTGETYAEGSVVLQRGAQTWIGERLWYNFRTDAMSAEDFRMGSPPVFLGGERALTLEPVEGHRVIGLTNGFITTDDLADPAFRVRARSMTIREDRRVVARNATLYLGDTPVFWFPYYTRQLVRHPVRWHFTPGYRTLYGAYLRSIYAFDLTTNIVAGIHVDGYTRRGVGLGGSVAYDFERAGTGDLHAYWIADQNPEDDPLTGEEIDRERHRIRFDHRVTLREGLTATAVLRQQSDRWVIRDFFEDEYRRDPVPDSFLEVQQSWPDFTLNALTRVQVNDFFETVERLPDVKLSAHRQELGRSGIFYEGDTSAGWYRRRFATPAPTNDYSAFRADTFHQLLLPRTLFGWLNVTPRVGGRLTYYGDTDSDGWENLDAETRAVFNAGAEVSFKAHRVWHNARSRFWDVTGLRHIIEPSINYAWTPEPDARPLDLPQFDSELPSLRPLPVMYPDYNAIDSIDSQNVLRLGMRNKLQTRRDGLVEDIVDWVVITDWRLDPRRGQGDFSDIYSEADFKPFRWLTLSSEVRFDPSEAELRESHTTAVFEPGMDWSFSLLHRYTRDDPVLGRGGNLIGTQFFLRFSENWGMRTSHYYELRDGIMQEQYYTLYRDLRSITAALTLRFRDSLSEGDEFAIALGISLKAFPRFRLRQDAVRPELLIGG